MLTLLRSEHEAILAHIAHCRDLLAGDQHDVEAIHEARFRFDRWLNRHLDFLGGTVFPALRQEGSLAAVRLEGLLSDAVQRLLHTYHRHAARFRGQVIARKWPAYLASADTIMRQLNELVGVCVAELYPLLERIEERPGWAEGRAAA